MEESYRSRYEKLKRQRKQRQRKIIIVAVLGLCLLIVAIIGIQSLLSPSPPLEILEEERPSLETNVPTRSISVTEVEDTFHLELVNFQYPLRRSINYDSFAIAFPNVPAQSAYTQLYAPALQAIDTWFRRGQAEGIADFFLASGYRDIQQQTELYYAAQNNESQISTPGEIEDPSFVNAPGHSEHHTGLAADIAVPGVLLREMAGTPAALWLEETAWEYGFIKRYTEGTSRITGIAHEPWHFRFVGQPHAHYIFQNNLVLEQYLSHLRANGVTQISFHGQLYEVWHQIPYQGQIYVPALLPFTVSSDNMGGFIVTVTLG